MMIGILGILKADGAYLPIDPGYPQERKKFMLNDCDSRILLTQKSYPAHVNFAEIVFDIESEEVFSGQSPGNLDNSTGPDNLVYVIYTSGTTGKPRGTLTMHYNVIRVVRDTNYIDLTGNDRVLQLSNYAFDGSTFDIYGALLNGSTLVMLKQEDILGGDMLVNLIERERISVFFVTTALFNTLVDIGIESFDGIRKVLFGGERVSVEHARRALEHVGRGKIIHMYGPTETTVYASYYYIDEIGEDWDTIPIGKPLANTGAYILDKHLKPQPLGVPGEIYIGGDGLARGYLNRPELTAEKFLKYRSYRSYSLYFSEKIYKTGDLARWLPDGDIEFIGRIDQQIKIRGFRVELGEIESRLTAYAGVREAVVRAVPAAGGGDKRLCAYIVGEEDVSLDVHGLREYLSLELPDYMIPSFFIQLEKVPLTPNGKVDSKALPLPEISAARGSYAAPENKMQQNLVRIWSTALALDKEIIGIDDNFFELGGHSLKGTVVITKIHKEFDVRISLSEMFRLSTIRRLSAYIEEAAEDRYISIVSVEEKEYYDLSYAQRRLWILCQFEEDSSAYNIPGVFVVSGEFDTGAYARAIQALIHRHESLRTVFISVNGEPKQRIIDHWEYHVEHIDLSNAGLDQKAGEQKAREIFRTDANYVFNLEQGPLCLFETVRLEDKKYLVIISIHHIVSDGWSQGIIYNEIFTLYNTFSKGAENPNPLMPLNLRYKDYTRWHNKLIAEDHFKESETYWLEKFKDKPNGIELPLDHHRQPIQTFNGNRLFFCIDKVKTLGLHGICKEENVTLFMGLLSLCNIFLYKYTGQRDVMIGAPIAGRKRTELNTLVGFFVNTLVYRMEINPHEGFRELLKQMKRETLDCYEYQDYPFDLLIDRLELDRDLSQSPLFNVMLAHNNSDTLDSRLRMEGVSITDYPYRGDFNMSKFDLIFFMDEIGDHIDVFLEYNSDLFEYSTIGRMVKNFLVFLENVLEDPGMPTAELNYLHKEEYERVTEHFNSTSYPFPGLSIQGLFERQVRHSPDKTAVVDVDGSNFITYDELNKRANQVACYLREEYSVKPGYVIGISVDRSLEMIIAVLGAVKSGAGYVAIDPNYPEERVLHMLSDSRAGLLIVDEMRPGLFGDYKGKVINIHGDWENIALKSNQDPRVLNRPANILYVIYTSGSTGVPNGAMLSHGILTNLVRWQIENSSIDASLRCLQFTSVNFCVSFQEIMITLTAGGELHLIGDIERQDVDYLMDFLNSHRIELLYLPFSYLNFLFNESGRFGELYRHYLKHIVTAGEQLKITSGLRKFLAGNPGIRLHNHYGSSEVHVVTSYTLDAATMDKLPIPPAGKPVANTKIYILDDYYHPVPVGVWGELFVEGHSEVPGYINNLELTGQKLLDHPVFSANHKRLYRSGDLGRWLEDGNIELKGRKDNQVKIRGFRVEPGEIESEILLMEAVRDCVVVVKEDKGGQKHLVAYVVGKGDDVGPWEIKRNIANFLPQYMIPQIAVLDRLPLMPNGKVDRDNLPEPGNLADEEYTAPRNKIERILAGIWSGLLGIETDRISVHANFFDVGGHSMKATVMVSEIHKAFDVKVPLTGIFRGPTIGEIAECIKGAAGENYTSIEPIENKEYYALSPAQKRLYIIQQLDMKSITYNLPQILLLKGRLDIRKLEETFGKLVNRHESFRTSFITVNDETVQKINDDVKFEIEYYKVEVEDKVEEISGGFVRPFDLSQAPLLRVGLAKIEEEQYIFMVDMHHIIADGVSYTIFVEELMALYGGNELPELKLHYRDYSEWQKRMQKKEISALRKQESFWLKEFEKGIPVLEIPTDYERPEVLSFEGSHLTFEIGKEETGALRKFIKEQDVTLFMVLLAVFYVLLAKNSGQEDAVVGIPVMGRGHADLQPIIGMFVNTLAFRNYSRGSKTFKEFLMGLKERALKVFDNQDYPFEELVDKLGIKRKGNRNVLFDVMFGLQNLGDQSRDLLEIKIPGLELTPYDADIRVSRNDLCLYAFEKSDRIDCLFEYSTRLFEKESIEIMQEEYLTLLGNVLENTDCRIEDLDYKTEIERTLTEFEDIKIDF
jgi:amino acid adenylation domain-containing protein